MQDGSKAYPDQESPPKKNDMSVYGILLVCFAKLVPACGVCGYEEVKRLDKKNICGVKIFMGSSTGNMLVDKERALNDIFKNSEVIITTHCEDEQTVNSNLKIAQEKYGDNIPFDQHPIIRSREACYKSSSHAIS